MALRPWLHRTLANVCREELRGRTPMPIALHPARTNREAVRATRAA